MSQQYSQNRAAGGGSVRRARERMEAGLPPDVPPSQPQRMYDPSRAAPPNRAKPQMPTALATTRAAQGPIGVAISRPTQVPQWPLSGTIEGSDNTSNQQYQPPAGRGPAPQRPPRPSHVPSMLDASKLQEPTPSFQYRPQQTQEQTQWRGMTSSDDEESRSPDVSSPMTQSSRPSTISSVGSIPDFPVPVLGPPRRSVHLGPPPSARRGASSYYSQASFVSPIPEESPRTQTSHRSYASSAAIPSSWGSEYEYEDETPDYERDVIEERGESRESNFDDGDERGLIRSASIGKRAKPSMITTKSSENAEQIRPGPTPQQGGKLERMGYFDGTGGTASGLAVSTSGNGQRETMWPMGETSPSDSRPRGLESTAGPRGTVWPMGDVTSPLAGGTGLIDASTSSSEMTVPTLAMAFTSDDRISPIERGSPDDKVSPMSSSPDSAMKAKEMLGAYNAASTLKPAAPAVSRTPSPNGFSRLSAIRRPPRLDMDAVRDAEARGSLTSLPDLIRRATRLAAMMDRGKRPGSRLNDLNDFPMDEKDFERGYTSPAEKRRSGLSGMLAAFPPPGADSRQTTPRPPSVWPNGNDGDHSMSDRKREPKSGRRCCGLPCWGVILILLILLIIVAAAVAVPLVLLVFRKPSTSTTPALSALQQCEANTATACQNGGASLIDNGACGCVCTNGFTGSTCSIAGATGCTTTTLGDFNNVTLGDSIPRLILAAQTNFSIPLSVNTLLGRFSHSNLSCTSENSLVTFNGAALRRGGSTDVVKPTASATPTPTSNANSRRDDQQVTSSSPTPYITNGIIIDTSAAPTMTATATSSSATASPSSAFVVTEQVVDFARTAVLYILQQEAFDSAVNAQSAIQKFFDVQSFTNRAAMNVSLGNGNTVNLVGLTIDVGNGTIGKGSSRSTRRSLEGRSQNLWSSY